MLASYMCGISVIVKEYTDTENLTLTHRGPDQHVEDDFSGWRWVFDRLAINGIDDGQQPFKDDESMFVCNGEIYNHKSLCSLHNIVPTTGSDCEVVYRLLNRVCEDERLLEVCGSIDGEYAFVYKHKSRMIVARDRFGVRPLYYGMRNNRIIGFASEAKGLAVADTIEQFPPGNVWVLNDDSTVEKHYLAPTSTQSHNCDVAVVRSLLIQAVHKRLMSERPIGFFLSGGLDSSVIAAIAAQLSKTPITTYSIGMKDSDSKDLIAARKVAAHLNANHIEVQFDAGEAIDAIPEVIKHLESYDCTTIRASVPMFLLCREVAKRGQHKVLLSGEGADELFGGYLYLHGAPTVDAFQAETIQLLNNIHQFDGLRADRCTAAHGLELRVPFLDTKLTDYVLSIRPDDKVPTSARMEKYILRKAFEDFLPNEIIYRQKNGMSDAVGSQWIDEIKKHVSTLSLPQLTFPINSPMTDEELWYRIMCNERYANVVSHRSIWRPKWTTEIDPSARKLANFNEH
jgi:asparagine synthase (glutamine-hydrolysing)